MRTCVFLTRVVLLTARAVASWWPINYPDGGFPLLPVPLIYVATSLSRTDDGGGAVLSLRAGRKWHGTCLLVLCDSC